MKTFLKLILLTLIINILRYFPLSWLEAVTIFEPMHAPMESQASCFGFRDVDFGWSLFYNFLLWFWVILGYHMFYRGLKGSHFIKSLLVFGFFCLFFISLAAIYMNHFNMEIRTFFRYSMLDALIIFIPLSLANGWLYPRFFREEQTFEDAAQT